LDTRKPCPTDPRGSRRRGLDPSGVRQRPERRMSGVPTRVRQPSATWQGRAGAGDRPVGCRKKGPATDRRVTGGPGQEESWPATA